jgi:hypothetical protein
MKGDILGWERNSLDIYSVQDNISSSKTEINKDFMIFRSLEHRKVYAGQRFSFLLRISV